VTSGSAGGVTTGSAGGATFDSTGASSDANQSTSSPVGCGRAGGSNAAGGGKTGRSAFGRDWSADFGSAGVGSVGVGSTGDAARAVGGSGGVDGGAILTADFAGRGPKTSASRSETSRRDASAVGAARGLGSVVAPSVSSIHGRASASRSSPKSSASRARRSASRGSSGPDGGAV
jgi:hypothetical protein